MFESTTTYKIELDGRQLGYILDNLERRVDYLKNKYSDKVYWVHIQSIMDTINRQMQA